MAKKKVSKTRKVAKKSEPKSLGPLAKIKSEHGIVAGVLLILLKGVLGISILIGLIVLVLSTVKYASNHLGKK